MSFFNSILKVMGFANDDHDTFESDGALAVVATGDTPAKKDESAPVQMLENPSVTAASDNEETTVANSTPRSHPSVILNGIVELLNRELPPYLRQCLDEEKQRQYIYELLDESIKTYITQIGDEERMRASRNAGEEKKKIKSRISDLELKLKATEEKLSRETEKALSAERQKRGMTARVRDVENQVAALQAEKEQYDLENKSLLNKLRVMSVTSGVSDETLAAENIELKGKLENLQKAVEDAQENISGLEKLLSQLKKTQRLIEEENKKLKNENSELTGKNASLKKQLEEATTHAQAAETEQFEPEGGYIAFEEELIMPVSETAKSESTTDNTATEDFSPEIIIPTDVSEPEIGKESSGDGAQEKSAEQQSQKKHRNRKKKKGLVRISAIDEDLADTDWLVAEPPAAVNEIQSDSNDFGYKEPPKKPVDDNPAQMSFW